MFANFWKLWIIGGMLALPVGASVARQDPVAAFHACQRMADNEMRLTCFDAIDFGDTAPVRPPGKSADKSPDKAPVARDRVESGGFGAESIKPSQKKLDERPGSLTATLVEVRINRNGKAVFVLDNGQVWHQIKGDSNKILLPREVKGLEVIIKRKLLGSFALRLKGTKNSVRVRRGR